MTTEELNNYILNYLKNDKTRSAIMLTASWGTGKSYYIDKKLKPFLNSIEDNETDKKKKSKSKQEKVVCVSLYGLKSFDEVNRALYIENKLLNRKLKNKTPSWLKAFGKPLLTGAIGIGKTILRSVASVDLDLSVENPDMQKLYDSVDLSKKLVVLEDIERSQIDIIELMGYVNNLCEQDGVKVLLVANENEILKSEPKEVEDKDSKDGKKKTIQVLTEKTQEYLRVKEKTVSDTIHFYVEIKEPIQQIMKSFNDCRFNEFLKTDIVDQIKEIMNQVKTYNLRSFIYACQRTVDLYQYFNDEYDIDFVRAVFLGNVAFCLRLKEKDDLKWNSKDENSATSLGLWKYPLYHFAYDYIKRQLIKKDEIEKEETLFKLRKQQDKYDQELKKVTDVVYYWSFYEDNEVITNVELLLELLKKGYTIRYQDYGKISSILIYLKGLFPSEKSCIDKCLDLMIETIKKSDIEGTDLFDFYIMGLDLETEENRNAYNEFVKKVRQAKKEKSIKSNTLKLTIDSLQNDLEVVRKNKMDYHSQYSFAKNIDLDNLLHTIKLSTSEQVSIIQEIFSAVYYMGNVSDFFADDKESLERIYSEIYKLSQDNSFGVTKKHRLKYLLIEIKSVIDKL